MKELILSKSFVSLPISANMKPGCPLRYSIFFFLALVPMWAESTLLFKKIFSQPKLEFSEVFKVTKSLATIEIDTHVISEIWLYFIMHFFFFQKLIFVVFFTNSKKVG